MLNVRDGINLLMMKIRPNRIIIKPADKGSIVVVMTPEFYWKICQLSLYIWTILLVLIWKQSFLDYRWKNH